MVKKSIIATAILMGMTSAVAFAQTSDLSKESVTIYNDYNNEVFGYSPRRASLLTVKLESFGKTQTYYAPNDVGSFLTAVTVDPATADRLNLIMKSGDTVYAGTFELSLDNPLHDDSPFAKTVYRLTDRAGGFGVSFGLERPGKEMLRVVEAHYADQPRWSKVVGDRYLESYVIRVYAAESVTNPWSRELHYADALLAATLLGDRAQDLWGIHNGSALLERVLAMVK